jgi:preprotein translocase subunit SecA
MHRVNDLGPVMIGWTDAEIQAVRHVLSRRLAEGETLEAVMPQAFAAMREAARRTIGRSYSDTYVMAGAVLYSGRAAEVEDDGCNDFITLLPIYLCALLHERVHYVTTTASLARRSFQEVERLCTMLGLRVGLLSGTAVSVVDQAPAHDVDVTYGSYQKFVFEYLGDHLALDSLEPAARRPQVAIMDQIDSILIDQANLPLVIKAPKSPNTDLYQKVAAAASELKRGKHFEIDAATGEVSLSSEDMMRGAALLRVVTLEGLQAAVFKRYLEDALRARAWYRRGKDYQIAGAKIVINGGRGSRSDSVQRLHEGVLQAIEAKEGLAASPEEAVWARMTVSDYFRTYAKLCGVSGALAHSSSELERFYGLRTTTMPVVRPSTRVEHPELMFETARSRFEALVQEVAERHQADQPVVIGVGTAADSRLVGGMLEDRKIEYAALLPGDDEAAVEVMDRAGRPGSVTVMTAEVARGCDVVLDRDSTSQATSESVSRVGLAVLDAVRPGDRINGCVLWPAVEGSPAKPGSSCHWRTHFWADCRAGPGAQCRRGYARELTLHRSVRFVGTS